MGDERVTVQTLEVVRADLENGLLLIKGAAVSAAGGDVVVRLGSSLSPSPPIPDKSAAAPADDAEPEVVAEVEEVQRMERERPCNGGCFRQRS